MTQSVLPTETTREDFVGHKNEIAIIHKAISDKGHLRLINIQGAGGIGKTSILQKVQKSYAGQEGFFVSEFIDFFDTSIQSWLGFLDEIVRILEKLTPYGFEKYKKERDDAIQIELAGITGNTLENARKRFIESFEECYKQVSKYACIIMLMDTFENIQYKPEKYDSFTSHFLRWLQYLKNTDTVLIIAGRENKKWQDDFILKLGDDLVKYLELKDFKANDTKELFELSEVGRLITDKEREKLQILTEGRPLLLNLTLDWYSWKPDTLSEIISKYELEKLNKISVEELKRVQENFERELIERFRYMGKYDNTIKYMAIVYKYFTADFLAFLLDMEKDKAQQLLFEMQNWSFMKYNERTGTYQLHDLVRELIIKYIWKEIDPTKDIQKSICKKTVEYYEKVLIKDIRKDYDDYLYAKRHAMNTNNYTKEIEALRALSDLKRKQQIFQAHQAYYDIIADDEKGIIRYRETFVANVWAMEREAFEFVQQHRDEAIYFLEKDYPDNYKKMEEARIKIVVERKLDDGLKILENLFNNFNLKKDPHLYVNIVLYQGIAYTYKGEYEKSEEKLTHAINILRKLEYNLENKLDSESMETRQIARSMGRAYGNLGFTLRIVGRLSEAISAYKEALKYNKIGSRVSAASASTYNDLSYAYARIGKYDLARKLCREGLETREKLLLDYHIGLSYSTLGGIEYRGYNPYIGKQFCEKALAIFQRIDDARGLSLTYRGLAANLTLLGRQQLTTKFFKEAEEYLIMAEEVFKAKGEKPQPEFLADIYEKWALLYQEWGKVLTEGGENKNKIDEYFNKSELYFKQCIEVYRKEKSLWSQAIAMERLFVLYALDIQNIERASSILKDIEVIILTKVPKEFLQPINERERRLSEIEFKEREFFYPLGKMLRGKGRLNVVHYRRGKDINYLQEASKNYTIACAYLEQFSDESQGLRTTFDDIVYLFKDLSVAEISYFRKYAEKTQAEYGMEIYTRILKWIEELTGLKHDV